MNIRKLHNIRTAEAQKAGFSLAELMVVIVIIGLLATLVVPNVIKKLGEAFGGKAKADLMALDNALSSYAINNGQRYPESLEELVIPDENGHAYLTAKKVPLDPWGQEYQYEPPYPGHPQPRVFTLGKDGAIGGEGSDGDMSNLSIQGAEE